MTDSPLAQRPPRIFALIPCAGTGSRAGTRVPKQYESIAGAPVVMHTLRAFSAVPRVGRTLVVVAEGDRFFDAPMETAALVVHKGGPTRAETVLNGLLELRAHDAQDTDWVLVHDAARCLVTPAQIDALIDACVDDAVGGLLACPLADTLKQESHGRAVVTVERTHKWLAQTPQMFRVGPLIAALRDAGASATDEASAMEAQGQWPLLVQGSTQNFKVTWPEDFALAQAILRSRA